MTLKKKVARLAGIPDKDVPGSYQVIGDILLAKFSTTLPKKKKIARAILSIMPYIRTVCEIKEVRGEYREPVVKIIEGTNTVTIHKENEILYKLDVAKVMFSKGNLFERKRLLNQIKDGETVVDMFAGIGYFTLPIAKFTKAKEIISIEKNPVAYNFLTDNITLNKLNNVIAIQGDCKTASISLKERADRILMGYFPGTEEFLLYALYMAKPGCIIHFHNTYAEKDLWNKPLAQIAEMSAALKKTVNVIGKKKVKSVGPRFAHVVMDLRVA